jgi:hypothetical protein
MTPGTETIIYIHGFAGLDHIPLNILDQDVYGLNTEVVRRGDQDAVIDLSLIDRQVYCLQAGRRKQVHMGKRRRRAVSLRDRFHVTVDLRYTSFPMEPDMLLCLKPVGFSSILENGTLYLSILHRTDLGRDGTTESRDDPASPSGRTAGFR